MVGRLRRIAEDFLTSGVQRGQIGTLRRLGGGARYGADVVADDSARARCHMLPRHRIPMSSVDTRPTAQHTLTVSE